MDDTPTRKRGRPPTHGLTQLRTAVRTLGTARLDGRSAIARAVRDWKAEVRRDLGGELSRAQETLLESAAGTWVIVSSLDDWLARQPALVTRKRAVVPVVAQRQALVDSLARLLDRLGLKRVVPSVTLEGYLAEKRQRRMEEAPEPQPETDDGPTEFDRYLATRARRQGKR